MKANHTRFLQFLEGAKQFRVPIYQRTYNWTDKQCRQLWDDIIRVGYSNKIDTHFIGSIVYIGDGPIILSTPQVMVIDGQQRLTTLSLLLVALRNALDDSTIISKKEIDEYYLFNNLKKGQERYKLVLTQRDKETLFDILDENELTGEYSKNIKENLLYFEREISNCRNLESVYRGISKLIIVDISLESKVDNPQLIFESLNSTGLDLSQADLIRNYVLLDLPPEEQERIYDKYWLKIEKKFIKSGDPKLFDRFMRDYLTIKTSKIPNIRNVYSSFKAYVSEKNPSTEELVSDIDYFSKFFVKLAFPEDEPDNDLREIIHNINMLEVKVAYPFLMEILVEHDKEIISKEILLEIFLMVESYVFRRSICAVPTNSLNKIFSGLAGEIDKDHYIESLKAALHLKEAYRRFPADSEFKHDLRVKNIYYSSNKRYLLEKIEKFLTHDSPEAVSIDKRITIEHIMPQTDNLSDKWKEDLGPEWARIQDEYMHTIGNLTLTGFNSPMGDKSFSDKKYMENGFDKSNIAMNQYLKNIGSWNEDEIQKRANMLIDIAVKIWKYPYLNSEVLLKYQKEKN